VIFHEVAQGSEIWMKLRSGKTTASCVADAISMVGALDEKQQAYVDAILAGASPKDAAEKAGYKAPPSSTAVARVLAGCQAGVPSDTAHRYAADLAIEQISGQPHGEPPKAWVLERGHIMEERARMLYEARTGAFVTESGICISDCESFAYSSDGLVNDDGLIEIKSPIDSLKIATMLRTGDVSEYLHQMQTGMWLTGRKWCDFIMFVPDLANCGKDLYVKRVMRDDEFIDGMVKELVRFQAMIADYKSVFMS
jgi:exodeoxyribonuclease (lambda-induced)